MPKAVKLSAFRLRRCRIPGPAVLLLLLLWPGGRPGAWASQTLPAPEGSFTNFAGSQTSQVPFFQLRNRSPDDTGVVSEAAEPTNVDEVRFGWFGPSDPEDPLGGQMWWAADQAIREANDQGGLGGRPFRLIPKWSENPWGNGVPQVFRMVYEDKVWALLGGIDGSSTHLAQQVVAKASLPLLSPVSTDKSVNLAGVPWIFSCAPGDHVLAPLLAEAVSKTLNGPQEKLVMFSATDHDSRMAAKEMIKALSERQRAPDFKFEFQAGQKAVDPQLSSAAAAKPRVVVLIAGPEDSARWVVAIRQQLSDTAIFGTHQMGRSRFLQLAGEAAEGVRFPLLWTPDESDAVTRKFTAAFNARFGQGPDYAAALSFDATRLLIAATRQGGLNRTRIREALITLSPWQGIAGTIQWDGTGQNLRKASRMGTIRNGRIKIVGYLRMRVL
jgi:ABC-type branched-subunit amino acid transport system substrate-binding protein